jgi:hypothetical protein
MRKDVYIRKWGEDVPRRQEDLNPACSNQISATMKSPWRRGRSQPAHASFADGRWCMSSTCGCVSESTRKRRGTGRREEDGVNHGERLERPMRLTEAQLGV